MLLFKDKFIYGRLSLGIVFDLYVNDAIAILYIDKVVMLYSNACVVV